MDNNVEKFFIGKYFRVPNYQRDYAWDTENVDDLFEDILEAIETETSHYIGTFILALREEPETFNIVDGQQRLTTLIMLLNVVINKLKNKNDKIIFKNQYIRSHSSSDFPWKLKLLNDNDRFFHLLLEGKKPRPVTRSQKLLIDAYDHIQLRVNELEVDHRIFLDAIRRLEVMEFTENNDGKAIRMFQTVNDRGKPLTNMEKAKSLLIYYSNRFLDGELDNEINEHFGNIFHIYTKIKTIGEESQIDVISSRRFSEDSVMRYHFLAYAEDLWDYDAPESYVLDTYLKKTLKPLRSNKLKLKVFIKDYVLDLYNFFDGFSKILDRVRKDTKYYKLFSILGISATLYPLIIRLETRNLLENKLTFDKKRKIIDLIEVADFRVYKVRNTNPRVDMSWLAKESKLTSQENIEKSLIEFIDKFMGNDEFERFLKNVYHNTPSTHLIIEYSEFINKSDYKLGELKDLKATQPTVEHIFPQQERFEFPNLGFPDVDDYKQIIQTIGNLTVLERNLNSQCQNRTPDQKISGNFYERSSFEDPKRISAQNKNRGTAYTRGDIIKRTEVFTEFCMSRWFIRKE